MRTGKITYSDLLKLFYKEIIVKKMPLSYLKRKYKFSIDDWLAFEKLYNAYLQAQNSYAEINNRTFQYKTIYQQHTILTNFTRTYKNLLDLTKNINTLDLVNFINKNEKSKVRIASITTDSKGRMQYQLLKYMEIDKVISLKLQDILKKNRQTTNLKGSWRVGELNQAVNEYQNDFLNHFNQLQKELNELEKGSAVYTVLSILNII